jgi:hypothetical protein
LEFASMGVPSVVGRLPAYERAAEAGLPVPIVDTPEAMTSWANNLLDHPPHPEGLRQVVRERFTLENVGGLEWEAWAAGAGAS